MRLTDEEFEKLQSLSCIKFEGKEKEEFLWKLDAVIDFLGGLKNVEFDENMSEVQVEWKFLEPKKWVNEYGDPKWLLKNIDHEIVNNSVVVKSVFG